MQELTLSVLGHTAIVRGGGCGWGEGVGALAGGGGSVWHARVDLIRFWSYCYTKQNTRTPKKRKTTPRQKQTATEKRGKTHTTQSLIPPKNASCGCF